MVLFSKTRGPHVLISEKFRMKFLKFVVIAAACVQSVRACDICAIYSAAEARGVAGQGFFAGVAEQYTHFGDEQEDGASVPNPTGQYMNSSISQLFAGYNISQRAAVQFNAPLIYRSFKRPEGFTIQHGTESGLGDVSLTGSYLIVRELSKDESTLLWSVIGGVKFPTGSTDRLKEEFNEVEIPGAPESGIHGHDLTLGSGSYDGIVGSTVYYRWKRFFFGASVQYAIRTEGAFDYHFANDLTWSGGPGALLFLSEEFTLSLQANVSGETKGRDTFQGELAEDTGVTAVYLGPEFTFTWQDKLSAELGADLPVSIDNTALQVVPSYRIHAAFTWRF
jgi:hypothetical protein